MEINPSRTHPILRIVDMTFHKEDSEAFVQLFQEHQTSIAQTPGCGGVILVERSVDHDDWIGYSTVSRWENVQSLNEHRESKLFGKVWPATKALFVAAPRATSYSRLL